MSKQFRLDRTAFKATNVVDADNHVAYWRTRPVSERLHAAWFLIMHAYGIDENTRMDKTVFEVRKR